MTDVLSAYLTDLARKLIARGLTEGVTLGDWKYQVGSGGYNPLNPTELLDVDPSAQALISPLGTPTPLGVVTEMNLSATATPTGEPGVLQVDGLSNIPEVIARKYLSLYSSDPAINGTWLIRERLSATSVTVNAVQTEIADPGPFPWELRQDCLLRPNRAATDFRVRLAQTEMVGEQISEVAIFCRIIRSPAILGWPLPIDPGQQFMFANCHFPPVTKDSNTILNLHVCVQA